MAMKPIELRNRAEDNEVKEVTGKSPKMVRPKPHPGRLSGGPYKRPFVGVKDLTPKTEGKEPKEVMGKACGGAMKKMAKGGSCRGMGKAMRGGKFGKNG